MSKTFLAIVGALILCSCQQSANNKEKANNSEPTEQEESKNIVRKEVPFSGDFFQITNMSSPNIVFTEGDYNIEIEGTENSLKRLKISVDMGTLTFSIPDEGDNDLNQLNKSNITVYVSCPELKILAMCGSGSFTCKGTLHASSLQAGIIGSGGIAIDTLICSGDFTYQTSGEGNTNLKHILNSGNATILLSGGGKTNMHFESCQNMAVDTDGKGYFNLQGKLAKADIVTLGESKNDIDIDADYLSLSSQDKSQVTLKGQIKEKEIHSSKTAKVTQY